MKRRNMILVVIGFLFMVNAEARPVILLTHKDSVNMLKRIIVESSAITGSSIGFAGSPSNTWYAFSWLINIATASELVEMTTHKNPVLRVYAYTGLLYRRYKPVAKVIQRMTEDTATVRTFSGCIMGTTTVGDAINNTGIWYSREGIQEVWKNIQANGSYRKELFNALRDRVPIKRFS